MLWGRYASRRGEARFPTLWDGRVFSVCPSIQGPSGLRLWDTSGRANHGTLTNMDAPTDWVRSAGAYALDFDGVNDQVSFLAIAPALGFGVSLWFRAASLTKDRHSLFANSQDNSPDIYLHLERISGSTYAMNFYNGGGYTGASQSFTLDTEWHHYVWRSSVVSGPVSYFRDGVSIGVSSGNYTATVNDANVASIGSVSSLSGSGFTSQGQIDDVIRYSRPLSTGELRTLARRRGISYEMRRDVVEGSSGFQAAWARRQGQIIGGGT